MKTAVIYCFGLQDSHVKNWEKSCLWCRRLVRQVAQWLEVYLERKVLEKLMK